MEIRINEQKLDANLEKEKTIGQVLAALEQWISDSGHILSGMRLDGLSVTASQIEEVFNREIDSVKILEIETNSLAQISASCLVTLLDDIKQYENLDFQEKAKFFDNWKESACAKFLFTEMSGLYKLCSSAFSSGEISIQTLSSITEERLREVTEPLKEFTDIEPVLNQICEKLVDLPLDIQTGKDIKAAQTIQVFTALTEKILRLFYQLDTQGFFYADGEFETEISEQVEEKKEKLIQKINGFTDVLKELLDAYEKNDSVLVGDLAEYEAAVKIKELYTSILESCPNGVKNDQ